MEAKSENLRIEASYTWNSALNQEHTGINLTTVCPLHESPPCQSKSLVTLVATLDPITSSRR
jgi:hypothetical protein